jgi:PAS domain S-box-containing protein
MIVDDTPENLTLLEAMLVQDGYNVRSFPLARLALAAAQEDAPDVILLDVNMPEMNGYEMCERLRAHASLGDVPVIFLSALSGTEDKVKGFQSGGSDFISKPFQLEEVQARVQTQLKRRRAQQSVAQKVVALRQSLQYFLELLPDGTLILSPKGLVSGANQKFCELVGYSSDDLLNKPATELFVYLPAPAEYETGKSIDSEIKRKDETTVKVGIVGRESDVQGERLTILTVSNISKRLAEQELLTDQLKLTSTLLEVQRELVLGSPADRAGRTDLPSTDPGTGALSRESVEELLAKRLEQDSKDDFVVLFVLREGPTLKRRFGPWIGEQVMLVASQLIGNLLVGEELLGRWSEYTFATVVKGDRGVKGVERNMRRMCSRRIEHFISRGADGEIMVLFTLEPRVLQNVCGPEEVFSRMDALVQSLTPESVDND